MEARFAGYHSDGEGILSTHGDTKRSAEDGKGNSYPDSVSFLQLTGNSPP